MNILIYDELPLFIYGIKCRWAELAPALNITAVNSEDELWRALLSSRPEIIIVDADYDPEKKSELLEELNAMVGDSSILMNFSRLSSINPMFFLEKGASGIITKKMDAEELLLAIEWVKHGRIYLPEKCLLGEQSLRFQQNSEPLCTLSPRQREILDLVVQGNSNKQICRRLGIAEGTVKNHLHTLFRQLGVRNRTEAAMKLSQLQA